MPSDYIKPETAKGKEEEHEHLPSVTGTKSAVIFVVLFVLSIYSVGIIQASVELSRGESIQFFDVFVDTFARPITRARTTAEHFTTLRGQLDSLQADLDSIAQRRVQDSAAADDYGDVELRAEEALFTIKDIKNVQIDVNRHIDADTTSKNIQRLSALYDKMNTLHQYMWNARPLDTVQQQLEHVVAYVHELAPAYDEPSVAEYPAMMARHFFQYTVFSERYLRGYEDEMEETSVAANSLRPYMQFYRYWLLHDVGEKAVLGKKDWLFYKPGVDYLVKPYIRDQRAIKVDPNNEPITDNPIAAISKFEKQLNEHGVELLVVIVPGKPSVYPDMIHEAYDSSDACTFAHTKKTIAQLREEGIDVVDLYEPIAQFRVRKEAEGETIYLERDTHWKPAAAVHVADVVADRVRRYPWFTYGDHEYVTAEVKVDRVGDVGEMTDLPDFTVRNLRMHFPIEEVTCQKVFEVVRTQPDTASSGAGTGAMHLSPSFFSKLPVSLVQKLEHKETVTRVMPYRDEYFESRILILGDSFSRIYQTDEPRSAGWIAHFSKEIGAPVASIVNDGGASTLVRETLSRKKKLLNGKKLCIWEFVERDLRYGAKGWKDIDL